MIDKNGDALNGEILAFIREHSLLPVMLLRQNQLAYLALGRLASDGYTIAQNDIAASLFAERNFDKSLWRKLTLSDDVWTEVVMVENSLLKRGTVIRHLILPGRLAEAKRVMDFISEEFPAGTVLFSLMSQYVPQGRASEFSEIDRRLRGSEARNAQAYMEALGLDGFTQEGRAADTEYIPPFDLTGV